MREYLDRLAAEDERDRDSKRSPARTHILLKQTPVRRPSRRGTTLNRSLIERPNLPRLLKKAREKSRAFVISVEVGLC
jgi:hypothetical protein